MNRGRGRRSRGIHQQPVHYNLRSAPLLEVQDSVDTNQVGTTNKMAEGFVSRDDPEYLKSMEDELIKSRRAREEETRLLNDLVSRMDKWEIKSVGSGRGILRTPLRTDQPSGLGLGRGSSPVDSVSSRLLYDHSASPAPADVINGPLTSVLQQLSVAIDPTPQSATKGLLLRPEYYVQHKDKGVPVKNLDYSKMSFKELMSGMGRVMSHLSKTGGDVASYIEHFSFITRKAGAHTFVDSAYVGCERHVTDQFINGDTEKFVAGDLFGIALYFHAGNVVQARPQVTKPFRGRGFRRGRPWGWDSDRGINHERDSPAQNPPLDGFPDDICYKYNYKICTGKCFKSHVCRMCKGNHKAISGQCPTTSK